MAATTLAKQMGVKVMATTRRHERLEALAQHGVDHPLLEEGAVATAVRVLLPEGVDAVLELVGTTTLPESSRGTRVHGTVCFTGMVSDEWTVHEFYPIGYIPTGVRLTAYGGEASDLPRAVLQQYLDDVGAGRVSVAIHRGVQPRGDRGCAPDDGDKRRGRKDGRSGPAWSGIACGMTTSLPAYPPRSIRPLISKKGSRMPGRVR